MKKRFLTLLLSATMLFSAVGFSACTNGELEAKIAELQAQITELQEQNEELQASVEEQQTQIADLEQENQELNKWKSDIELYNAVEFLDNAQIYMKADFLEVNQTSDALDTTTNTPKSINYIVNSYEQMMEMFDEPMVVNFEEEVLVIHIFTCYHSTKDYEVKSIKAEDNILKVEMKCLIPWGPALGGATPPIQRVFALKVQKADFISTEFCIV